MMLRRKLIGILVLTIALTISMSVVMAAGGFIEGSVTDTKKAAVVGATVTVNNPTTSQTFTAITDEQGHFKVDGLSTGIYRVTISAKGFKDVMQNITVEATKSGKVDVQLETAAADLPVSAKANSDSLYEQIRQISSRADVFGGNTAVVNNLIIKRDAATFSLISGEIYFLPPVEGRTIGAVFLGEGNLTLNPPTDAERLSMSFLTDSTGISESFDHLILRFTDKTFEEISQSPKVKMQSGGTNADRARSLYRARENSLRKEIHYNIDTRTLSDLYAPSSPGFFYAFVGGRRYNKLIFELDPQGTHEAKPDQVSLTGYGDLTGVWTAFNLSQNSGQATVTGDQDRRTFDITRHEIDGSIRGTRLTITDKVSWTPRGNGVRVLRFNLFGGLRVNRVQDEEGRDVSFIQEEKNADPDFAVVLPQAADAGKNYKLTVQYEGDGAMSSEGTGNYILLYRWTWYPNNDGVEFGDRAKFDITFRYPKGNTFVATGTPSGPELQVGDDEVTKWTTGETEFTVAGFNYGKFKRKELADKDTGYNLEYFGNTDVPNELKAVEIQLNQINSDIRQTDTASGDIRKYNTPDAGLLTGVAGKVSTTNTADVALQDTRNAVAIYTSYFGRPLSTRLAMTQQPAWFGQSWPTLVYMPYAAFMDSTLREQLSGDIQFSANTFWRYVGSHEVAHQWWGHTVGQPSYRDEWMSEGFADFSTSLYIQYVRKDIAKFLDYWEDERKLVVDSSEATKNRKPYAVGPLTQGSRLNNSKTGNIYRRIVYAKGAYVLQMIRMMMFDHKGGGDARFREMMTDFVKTYYNKDASTEDFKQIVEKHMSPQMDLEKNGRMDWFFNQWVYGTDVPAYRLDYKFGSADGKPTMTARITQSGVADNFRMAVPIYADFGKGWTRLGAAVLKGNSFVDLTNVPLPQQPKRLTICALSDVLATSIQVNKQ